MNEQITEELIGIQAARVDTDIYITDKPEIKRLPEDKPKPSKKEQRHLDKERALQEKQEKLMTASLKKFQNNEPEKEAHVLGNRDQKGPTYRMLKPEVKQTLDKLIY